MSSSRESAPHFAGSDGDNTGGAASEEDDERGSVLRELAQGTVVADKYRVEEVLGYGGMGLVVAATHLELGELVALKFLLSNTDRQGRSRFMREAKVCARMRNEHITRVLDVGMHKAWPYMVMEHLVGRDLRGVLRETPQLPLSSAVDYTVQLCEGLAEAHASSIVHRDLKPTNLFITHRPDGSELLKILDFGISKWRVETDLSDDLTKTGVILGTPRYMAPEQLLGSNTVDVRADVWSVGAILYEMIAGKPPYDQPSFAHVCAALANGRPPPPILEHGLDVPPEFEAVIMRCLEADVARRIQNVAELAGDLLEASGASIAGEIRVRITAVLEGNTPSPTHATSPPYASLVRAVARSRDVTRAREGDRAPSPPVPPRRSRAGFWALVAALTLGVCFAWYRVTRRPAVIVTPREPAAVSTPQLVHPAPLPMASPIVTANAASLAVATPASSPSSTTKPAMKVVHLATAAPSTTASAPPPPAVASTPLKSPLEERQ